VGFPARSSDWSPIYAGGEGRRPSGRLRWEGIPVTQLQRGGPATYSAVNEIIRYVVDKGLSGAARERIGENLLQPRCLQLGVDRRSHPQCTAPHRQKVISASDMRRGLETLDHHGWLAGRSLGLEGFGRAVEGHLQRPQTGITSPTFSSGTARGGCEHQIGSRPMRDRVLPLLDAAAKAYVSKDPTWPKRNGGM